MLMPTSLYNEGAMRNSIVVDLAHDLAEYYTGPKRPSHPSASTSIPSNMSCPSGASALQDTSGSGEQLPQQSHKLEDQASPSGVAQESVRLSKASRPPAQQTPHHVYPSRARRLSDHSEDSGLPSVHAPHSREPSGEEEDAEDAEDAEGSGGEDNDNEEDEEESDEAEEEDEEEAEEDNEGEDAQSEEGSDPDASRGASARSLASGAETVPWTRAEASSSCVSSSAYGSQYSTTYTATATTSSGGSTSNMHATRASNATSMSALPSALLYSTSSILRRPSAARRRRGSASSHRASQPLEATHNDMSMPFLFTNSGSFAAFPSPPEEGDFGMSEGADGDGRGSEILQQSAVLSEMGFSYGGPGYTGTSALTRATNARPSSRRRSLNRTSLSHINVSPMHRQSSAITSMLYSTIDAGGAGGADHTRNGALAHGKLAMEGTFPSSMMYLYARTPSLANAPSSGVPGSGGDAHGGRRRRSSEASTDSNSSGVTSSSASVSDSDSGEGSSSFFKSTQDVRKRSGEGGRDRAASAAASGQKAEDAESPLHRALLPTCSGFSPGLNVRVLRGDFEASYASLDSLELAKAARKFSAAATTSPVAAAAAAAADSPGKAHAPLSATSTNSPAGITPDSDNSNVPSGRSGAGAASSIAPSVAAAEAMRRRSSGTTFLNFFRGPNPHPGKSATSMTLSSGWGATQAPNTSQQTVVGGWRLLSFRETDDTPLTNTEHVPHDKAIKKKSKKGKKGKKGKKKSGKERRAGAEEEAAAAGTAADVEHHKQERDAQAVAAKKEDEARGSHGDVAREVANAMMQGEDTKRRPPSEEQRKGDPRATNNKNAPAAATGGINAREAGGAASAQRGGASPTHHANTTSSTAAVAPVERGGAQGSPAKAGHAAPPEAKDVKPHPPLPPVVGAAPSRMRVARLPLRPARPASTASTTAAVAVNAGTKPDHDTRPPSSAPASRPAVPAVPKKPAERFDKFKEPPLMSPSATACRTTVRAADKPKVVMGASRRVNLAGAEGPATGVRKFRPNTQARLKTASASSSARPTPLPHTAAAAKPSPPQERLPPL